MVLTSVGTWLITSESLSFFGCILVGSAFPFVQNTLTKWSGSWFGPKGRAIALMCMIISMLVRLVVRDYSYDWVSPYLNPLSIASTISIFLALTILKDKPLLPPTLSEEERRIEPALSPQNFEFGAHLRVLMENTDFVKMAVASAFILVSLNETNKLLYFYYATFRNNGDQADFKDLTSKLAFLHVLCNMCGTATFGMAMFVSMSVKTAYQIIAYTLLPLLILYFSSLSFNSETYLIVLSIYDGLLKGGFFLAAYDVTAECGYPVGESLSLGFMVSISMGLRFLIDLIQGIWVLSDSIVYAEQDSFPLQTQKSFYVVMMCIYMAFNFVGIWLLRRAPFEKRRSRVDMPSAPIIDLSTRIDGQPPFYERQNSVETLDSSDYKE
jgi:hypothetical protein